MIDKAFLKLVQNVSLLLAAAFIFDVATTKWRTGKNLLWDIPIGLAIGAIGIIIMVTPWELTSGIVFDTRSVLIGITGLFLGWLPAAIVMAMTAVFRLFLGGAGAWTGVSVIIVSGAIGIAWRHFRRPPLGEISGHELYLFGIVVHLGMLAMMFTLPWETALRVLSNIALPVLAIYPVGTALLGMLMVNRLRRQRVEEELRGANSFLNSVIENIPNMIFVKDARDLRFIRFNRAGEEMFGYSRNELLGKNIYDFLSKEQADFFTQQDREVLQEKKVLDIPEGPLPTRNRGVRIRHTKKVPLLDANGNPEYLLGISEDITERKQAEAERERLLAAIEQAGEIVIIVDAGGIIQYVNPAFTSVTGYDRAEALGQNPRDLLNGDRQDKAFYRGLWRTITGGNTFRGRMASRRKDGTLYTEEATISPVFNVGGKIVSYVIVSRDITDHIRLTEQLQQAQKLESVGRLAGGVAHDFNNMLGVIIGHAEMALERIDPESPFYDDFEEIRKAAERSANLTRQLLAFARKQTVAPEVLDLNEIVEGMLKMLRRLIGENIDLAWLPGADLPPVRMDPGQIDQLLANLCINSRDAIAGVGKLTIETGKATFDEEYCGEHEGFVPGDFALLAVSDDGCGMSKELLANIFEPFFTTKGVGQGTGMGLATVYGIVKQNSGFINVYSEPGQGTTFKIYLPRHAGQCVEPHEKPPENIRRGGETVLLVEDESANLELGKMMLESFGYSVLASGSPHKALRLAEEHAGAIDLLMTDVVMPEMNGRELALRLQSLYPSLKCLFMSGYTANVIAHNGVLDEDVHFIQKPFSRKDLAAKVREALAQKQRG